MGHEIVRMNPIPPPGTTAPGLDGGTVRSRTTPAGVVVSSARLPLSGRTAGTNGVRTIQGERGPNGTVAVQISGVLLPGITPRTAAPNYNRRGAAINTLGPEVAGYQRAHIWGPGFGDEAEDGIMLAPPSVNLVLQNSRVEEALRDLQREAGPGGQVLLTAKATSHPTATTPPLNEPCLAHVAYTFSIQRAGQPPQEVAEVDITVGKPPVTDPDTQIVIEASGSEQAAVLLDTLRGGT